MKFTKEQVLNFSTNWKKFHGEGKHKKRPVVVKSGFPPTNPYYFEPQTHMVSDLKFHHHIMYNYFRNLPLERGMNLTSDDFDSKIRSIPNDLWYIFGLTYHSERSETHKEKLNMQLQGYKDIFGPEFTLEILEAFKNEVSQYKYEKVVDNH